MVSNLATHLEPFSPCGASLGLATNMSIVGAMDQRFWPIIKDASALLAAALESDPTLQAIHGGGVFRLINRDSGTDVVISVSEISARTGDDGNPRLSAMVDLLLAFSPLKSRHGEAYAAVRNMVRMIVEPEYWDEILD